jgi:hypothetical protein
MLKEINTNGYGRRDKKAKNQNLGEASTIHKNPNQLLTRKSLANRIIGFPTLADLPQVNFPLRERSIARAIHSPTTWASD